MNKDDQALVKKRVSDGSNFDLKVSTRGKMMLVLSLLSVKEYRNSQINCLCRLLTALSTSPTLPSALVGQQFASRVGFSSGAAGFLHTVER